MEVEDEIPKSYLTLHSRPLNVGWTEVEGTDLGNEKLVPKYIPKPLREKQESGKRYFQGDGQRFNYLVKEGSTITPTRVSFGTNQ